MKKFCTSAVLVLLVIFIGFFKSYASDVIIPTTLSQDSLNKFTKELGTALAYRQYQPAKPLGLTGFDVGIQININPIKDKAIWEKVLSSGDAPAVLPVPMLFVKKGLPFKLDLGVRGLPVPGTNLTVIGGNIKYSILEGTIATPAVGVTVDYTQVQGSDDFDLTVMTANASISKGFGPLSPYGGIAMDQIDMKIKNALVKAVLKDEKTTGTRLFAGLKFSLLPILALTAEVNMGETTSYGVTAAVGF